ncbi:MAG: hypothetical protein AVDCRST_MAG73-3999 [uncultured Thermomicrobiales bacterium]|uniref:Uncharacterized protein n=1 Tax=uncultured Thermomicrobiales bacterium TaxID=1645740 RepID=A0A6J4UZ54_9BACT|nr:MAG: hypothetical protein AVDCRST_MAG73-3999 [uncultured Thermomicrobiales bacterium]
MRHTLSRFWAWYERHYTLNVAIAVGLFLLQLVHLYWLSADVVALRLTGESYFRLEGVLRVLILLVDYTEIPALVATSLVYLNELRRNGLRAQPILFLLFLNSQWLHLFWITDEFVVGQFGAGDGQDGSGIPAWLAWVAIGIDYLELPVIVDTVRKLVAALRARRVGTFLREELG